jgi:hypothetical protein
VPLSQTGPEFVSPSILPDLQAGKAQAARQFPEWALLLLGGMVLPGSPADFGKLIADETEKWGKVIRAANIKAE